MRNLWILVAVGLGVGGALVACGGDDTVVPTGTPDASPRDAANDALSDVTSRDAAETGSSHDAGAEAAADASHADGGSDAAPPPSRLLLSYNGASTSELVAFGMQSQAVDGRLQYPGFIGTTYVGASAPWLMEQSNDVVALLNAQTPWVVSSSWNVALDDQGDGGQAAPYSDPDGVVVAAGNKAYVLRYTRNAIAVLDPQVAADGGAPTNTIDLSGQVQAAGDGYVEMTAGWYDATSQRLYVLLGNINRNLVACNGYCQLCSSTSPTLIAIDTTNDTVVPLGGDAGTGWPLGGYDPAFGPSSMVYDATNNRLLVLETGCNQDVDGGAGALVQREIEAVSLADGTVTELLDLTSAAYPEALFFIDAHHVIVQLDTAYMWDPSTTSLGPAIPNAPATFDVDTQGNLVGLNASPLDGGGTAYTVVSVNADGGVTTLGQNPFMLTNGFVSGAQLWPPR